MYIHLYRYIYIYIYIYMYVYMYIYIHAIPDKRVGSPSIFFLFLILKVLFL